MVSRLLPQSPLRRKEILAAYLFLLPTLIGSAVFIVGPMFAALGLSVVQWNLLTPPQFAGLANYQKLLSDTRIDDIYLTTFKIALATMAIKLLLGLVLAVLLDQKLHRWLSGFFRLSFFFPYVVSVTAVALMWSFLMNKDLGLVNYLLGQIGIERIPWLNSSAWSPVAVVITDVWKELGFYVIVFLGGLQSIPSEFYDAAQVDGANRWQIFSRVTLPLLSPTILFLSVIGMIGSVQIFAQPQILTDGGPGDATRTIVMYIYEQGFRFFDMGYASTIALSLFVVIFILTLLQFRLSRRWVFYQ
ncbi:MAG: sugar ABC transporter permease [Anaerolineae bacterium]|nr:sugar ABC transporter permease [Anaerolineae bacterium]